MRLRKIFVLQNHVVWVKSIAVTKEGCGRPQQAGGRHALPEPQSRACVSPHARRQRATGPASRGGAVQRQIQHRAARPCAGQALPGGHLVHSLQHGPGESREIQPSRHLPAGPAALVHQAARQAWRHRARPVCWRRYHPAGGVGGGRHADWNRDRSGLRGHHADPVWPQQPRRRSLPEC